MPGKSVRNPNYPKCETNRFTLAEYLAMFNATSGALKAISKRMVVGGPSTEQLGWVRELRNYASEHGVGLDFLSTHQYPSDPQVPVGIDGHSDAILAAVAEAKGLPLYITEYSVGEHDDASAAAGIVTYMPRLLGGGATARGPAFYSYWAFSDVFEEQCLDPTPFHNGWGLVNWQGVPKPSFRAFQMLHEAGDTMLPIAPLPSSAPNATHNFSVTTGPQTAVTVFATVDDSSTPSTIMVFVAAYGGADGQTPNGPNVTVRIELCGSSSTNHGPDAHPAAAVGGAGAGAGAGSKAGPLGRLLPQSARLRRVDYGHANPLLAWTKMGSPKSPSPAQIAALMEASQMTNETVAITHSAAFLGDTEPGCGVIKVSLPLGSALAVLDFALAS